MCQVFKFIDMRKEARKILFETLKFQGVEEVLFSTGKIKDQSALIETVIDAMEKFKNLHIHDVVGRSGQLPTNPTTDKEHEDLMKALYPKDNSKRFRR